MQCLRAEFLRIHDRQHATVDRGQLGAAFLRRQIVRVHPIRHDRTKEHGAFATPTGGPATERMRRPEPASRPSRCAVGLTAEP